MNEYLSHGEIFEQYLALTDLLGNLNDYYRFALQPTQAPEAWQYLVGDRQLPAHMIERFALGLAPPATKALEFLKLNDLSPAMLKLAGVLIDRIEGRITFPVFDLDGRIIGFSSRVWREGDERSKYYNSLASPPFHKSLTLYGLYQAKESIQRDEFAIVVEGNVDVIQLHDAGLSHAVAPCGTALTRDQLELLTHFTTRILFCFDADDAGVRAATKAKQLCSELDLPFVSFGVEGAKDPDEFIRQYGAQPIIDTIGGLLSEYKGREKAAG